MLLSFESSKSLFQLLVAPSLVKSAFLEFAIAKIFNCIFRFSKMAFAFSNICSIRVPPTKPLPKRAMFIFLEIP